MKSKRLRVFILSLGLVAMLAILWQFVRFDEPAYAGKSVSVWFEEYAYFDHVPDYATVSVAGTRLVVTPRTPTGNSAALLSAVNRSLAEPARPMLMRGWTDSSLDALRALGSNAVPYLVQRVQIGSLDRVYERIATRLPVALQRQLPNPADKYWCRLRALDALAEMGDAACSATPALIKLLSELDPQFRRQVFATLRSIRADGHSISRLLLQLGGQQRYAEVLEIARETSWEGPEVAQLFGEILQSPDAGLHRDAIKLLEAGGKHAAPALKAILAVLDSPDGEVRYLAARTLANFHGQPRAADHPQIEKALRTRLQDGNDMVRKVALQALGQERNDR